MKHYIISASNDSRYIILKIMGKTNRKRLLVLSLKAHELGQELGINRYLVNVTQARNTDTPVDSYNFVNEDMKNTEGIDKSARIATLVSPWDHSHDFLEMAAQNAGLEFRLFSNAEDALRFLLE
jgi:hypothetical protein